MTEQETQTPEEQSTSTGSSGNTNSARGPASNRNENRGGSGKSDSRSRNQRDYDDDDYDDYDDDEYNYDDYEDNEENDEEDNEEAGDDEIREIRTSGPNEYVPSTQRGRSRRINLDVKIEELHYKNIPLLTRFLDPRGRILSRRKTGVSAKIQRRAVTAIKRARHLALLPYTAEQTRVTRLRRRSR